MKKKILLLIAVVALALLLPAAVMAQSPGGLSYTSSIQVVNLDSSTANIGLIYYNQDGSQAWMATDQIPGNSNVSYFPIQAPAGFNGSVVISSDKPITAIANTQTPDFLYGAATTSFEAGSNEVSLPLIMCNNSGFNTWFNVQNAGTSTASVTVEYIPGSNGVGTSEVVNIAPGAAKTFDQEAGSSTKNCSTIGNPKFIGSAKITSNQPVVATVMELNTGSLPTLLGYNGFTSGSDNVVAPLLMANNSGFYSSLNIQNVGGSSTTVIADYSPNQVSNGFEPSNESCVNLAPGASCNLIQAGGQWTQQYIGGATVSANQDLVVIVNTHRFTPGPTGPFAASYEAFDPSNASDAISTPLIMSNNSSFWTSINVMNVGGSNCPAVTINYSPNLVSNSIEPVNEVFSLDAGESWSVLQTGAPPNNNSANNWGAQKYIGSAEVTAPGCSIVAVVNELALKKGDKLFTYDGYNH